MSNKLLKLKKQFEKNYIRACYIGEEGIITALFLVFYRLLELRKANS